MTSWRLGECPWMGPEAVISRHARVIVDNDFAGDPDDFFQLAHHLLTATIDLRMVVCSHLSADDGFDDSGRTVEHALDKARGLMDAMGLADGPALLKGGSEAPLPDRTTPVHSEASRAIVAEAMRDDTDMPLFYVAGGGLTDLASAWLECPAIAERMVVVWIGGREYPGLCDPAMRLDMREYNTMIDPVAARVVMLDAPFEIWQVPRDAYRQCLVSVPEIWANVGCKGAAGRWLWDALNAMRRRGRSAWLAGTDAYCLGDQPLVTISALMTPWDPRPASSRWTDITALTWDDEDRPTAGRAAIEAGAAPRKRPVHVLSEVDTRLTFGDFFAKFALFSDWQGR